MNARLAELGGICLVLMLSVSTSAGPLKLVGNGINAELDAKSGRLLKFGALPISATGGTFTAYDFKAKRDTPLTLKGIAPTGQGISAKYVGKDLSLEVAYSVKGGSIRVDGTLRGLADVERAIVLTYTIGVSGSSLRFAPSMNDSFEIGKGVSGSGTVYPIGAMYGGKLGLAMAIPPSAPCMFRMSGSKEGLSTRLYLGLSPLTKAFPNSAHFSFMIYECDPKWGFRDALRRYYAAFPEYYTHHGKGDGLWLFPCELSRPPNASDFLYHEVFANENIGKEVEWDHAHGVLNFPYMIVGQREIKHLDALPETYEEAMSQYEKWTPCAKSDNTKEALAAGGDTHLKQEVASSAIKEADGQYRVMLRNTPWGDDSVTFIMNPNPDLPGEHTTGGDAMKLIRQWMADFPGVDGIYIDSLGQNWVGKLNFRRDHFPYAKYPLTFDQDGRVALHNQLSHYEFLLPLRDELHGQGRLLMANGVYLYSAKQTEYADVKDTGRFWVASLVDAAGAESSSPSTDRWEFYRLCMGPKPYLILKYNWTKADEVRRVFNEALLWGVFITNSNNFGLDYWTNPKGYPRDKELYAWYVPLVRELSKAGWQPVSYASSSTADLWFERYGAKGEVYFTMYNAGKADRECALEIETKPLGLAKDAKVEQISGPGLIGVDRSSSAITVRTKLAANRTAVIRFSPH